MTCSGSVDPSCFEKVRPNEDDEREVDFRGGVARLHEVGRGSDEARVLGDLLGLRKLVLELESPGGERLRMPLLMTERL